MRKSDKENIFIITDRQAMVITLCLCKFFMQKCRHLFTQMLTFHIELTVRAICLGHTEKVNYFLDGFMDRVSTFEYTSIIDEAGGWVRNTCTIYHFSMTNILLLALLLRFTIHG